LEEKRSWVGRGTRYSQIRGAERGRGQALALHDTDLHLLVGPLRVATIREENGRETGKVKQVTSRGMGRREREEVRDGESQGWSAVRELAEGGDLPKKDAEGEDVRRRVELAVHNCLHVGNHSRKGGGVG
jgi:hypothetical protein